MNSEPIKRENLFKTVEKTLFAQPVAGYAHPSLSPHLRHPRPQRHRATDPAGLMLWGIDELVTYHYLVAEVYRVVPATKLPYEQFWKMSKQQQADHIWKNLFVERTPISEACRGVLTTLPAPRPRPQRKIPRRLSPIFHPAGPQQIHRPRHGTGQRLLDHHDQSRLRRQRAQPLARRIPASATIPASRRCCGSIPSFAPGPPPPKNSREWKYAVSEEISAATIDQNSQIPSRLDRPPAGDLSRREPAPGVPLSRRPPTTRSAAPARRCSKKRSSPSAPNADCRSP